MHRPLKCQLSPETPNHLFRPRRYRRLRNMDYSQLYNHQHPPPPAASTVTAASIQYLTREQLSQQLRDKPVRDSSSDTAVIDVRDSDYIGGHIAGCQNIPYASLDYRLPELVRTLRDKQTVVFHCMLSMQRGPSAALAYMREREKQSSGKKVQGEENKDEAASKGKAEQKVYVLQGGFSQWQEKYGEDKRLTEGYVKDLWDSRFY